MRSTKRTRTNSVSRSGEFELDDGQQSGSKHDKLYTLIRDGENELTRNKSYYSGHS